MVRTGCDSHSGYTLVELSIVIIIIGLLTASGLVVGTSMVERAAYIDSRKLLEHINRSLQDYYIVNGHLPCVASLTTLPGTSGFGMEISDCSTNPVAPGGTGRVGTPAVRIGMVPVRTLGLADSAASDKFGNRIIYAVTERLTDRNLFGGSPGAITIRDMNNNSILSDAAYVLVSHGRDRKGAYAYSTGNIPIPCNVAANLDTHNCDLSDAIFREAPFSSGDVANTFFDDLIHWVPKFHFMAYDTQSASLWSSSGDNIYSVGTDDNTATGNVGIGTSNPTLGKLHVEGGPIYTGQMWLGKSGDTTLAPDIHMDHSGLIAVDDDLYIAVNGDASAVGNIHFYTGGLNTTSATKFGMLTGNNSLMLGLNGGSTFISGSSALNQRLLLEAAQSYDDGAALFMYGRTHADYPGQMHYYSAQNSSSSIAHTFRRRWGGSSITLLSLYADGSGWMKGALTQNSDKRLKKDITPIEHALDKLRAIDGVFYRWNGMDGYEDTESLHLGVIAQSVQAIFPELVKETETGYLAVDMNGLIPVLIEAVHELDGKNAKLESRVSELETRLAHTENLLGESGQLEKGRPDYLRIATVILLGCIVLLLLSKRKRGI